MIIIFALKLKGHLVFKAETYKIYKKGQLKRDPFVQSWSLDPQDLFFQEEL